MRENEGMEAKPYRRCMRFSLRTLLLVTAIVACWLGVQVNRAQKQRAAVAAIVAAGGFVMYPIYDGWRGLVVEYLGPHFIHGEFLVFHMPLTEIDDELAEHIEGISQAHFLFHSADDVAAFQAKFPHHRVGLDVPIG